MPTPFSAKSILFVDEELYVRKALQRSFRDVSDEWELRFANDPAEALQVMAQAEVDVLVTEMVFASGPSGLDFLETVRNSHPQTVRIILSGYVDRDITLKTVDLAHQFLSKPCDDSDLKATIAKAFLMWDLLAQDSLKKVVTRIDALPSLPSLYVELVEALKAENSSVQQVADIVSRDLELTAKLLKLVNSSFFGLPQRVAHPAKAVSLLGLDLVQSIVLASSAFEKFNHLALQGFSVAQLWDHAIQTAALAKAIAQEADMPRADVDTAFMAGLLHDIGKLLIASNLPEEFRAIIEQMRVRDCGMALAEKHLLGTTHAAIGAYLLGLWGLPDAIIDAVAYHHQPGAKSGDTLGITGIVHVADGFDQVIGGARDRAGAIPTGLDWAYLDRIGCAAKITQWQRLCSKSLAHDLH
ncbi:response regulator [Desulfatitalea tepidiphila]|uniref:response regulator n=1 Tax=Desulfatitalea tepidiphila TaxID=1185843 RepID=UPI0006B44C33|nr:response regulator [Desulfatitalea tepidiphila]